MLPWAASGQRLRDSYELVDVAARLGLLDGWALATASAAWSLLPAGVAMTCLAVLFRRPFASGTLSLCVGLSALGLVMAVLRSPLGLELGAQLALMTGGLSVLGALIVVVEQRRRT